MHLGEPCINKYCIPEVVAVALEKAGLPLNALQAKACGEEVLDTLGELFDGHTCAEHTAPYKITRHKARVTDGATNDLKYCDVFSVCCTVADGREPCTHVYDGDQDDLFNLNNSELFTHRMLINCLNDVRYKGSSFNAIRQVALAQQRALPPDRQQAMVSLPLFLRAFFGYIELLTELPGFICEICGEFPAAIIADGTGYKVFDRHLQPLRSFGHPSYGEQTRVRFAQWQHCQTACSALHLRLLPLPYAVVSALIVVHSCCMRHRSYFVYVCMNVTDSLPIVLWHTVNMRVLTVYVAT